jgi:hypothetical protein
MAVQLMIPFETLVRLVEQLPIEQRRMLIERLQLSENRQAERLSDHLMVFDRGVWDEEMTLRREDEYSDDGR